MKRTGILITYTMLIMLVLTAFVVLKLLNVITLNWIWVFSPLWLGIILTNVLFIVDFTLHLIKDKEHRRKDYDL